jgi:membrane-bound ClpP family serine protease
MDKNKIDIKYGRLFPWQFLFIGGIVLVIGLALLVENTLASIVLISVGGFILSGSEGTEIDKAAKWYREYNAFFFIKSGRNVVYSGIEKIFINTSKSKQKMYTAHTTHGSVYENVDFNGFLKFNDGTKIQLLRKRKKADLLKGLQKIASFLEVQIEDNTE